MKPYYEQDGITIYHGDARELLPDLPADVCLTDPPWKMATQVVEGNLRAVELWTEVMAVLVCRRLLVWLPCIADPREFLGPVRLPYLRFVYLRRAIPGYYGRTLMDGEVIHVLGEHPPARKGRMVIPGGLAITYQRNDRSPDHPAPRSDKAAEWLLSWWSDPGELILDPFVGSGTTLKAAKALGRPAVGIEIEERYCEIAARRLDQTVLAL